MEHHILLVEDDDRLGAQLADTLRETGYRVTWRQRGDDALEERPEDFDLAILDLMLPGAYGLDVLKHVRSRSDLPVLVLSARTETFDKVRALELGADDFMTKPFWPEELLARVQARLRRPVMQRGDVLRVGPIEVDLARRTVRTDDSNVTLTRAEFELIAALARRPGSAVARAELAELCLDPEKDGTERTLDVHVSRLRKKLGEHGRRVATVWGVGYRLDVGDGR